MAITKRSESTDPKTSASNTHAVTKPSGATTDDVLYALLAMNSTGTVSTAAAGWTELAAITAQTVELYLYRRVLTSGDSGTTSWTWSLAASVTSGSICVCLTGVDTTTPEDVAIVTNNAASNSNSPGMGVASVTTVTDGAWLLFGGGVNSNANTLTAPGGMTEIAEAGARKHELDYEERATAGVTGTRTMVSSGNTAWAALMQAVRPATAAAPTSLLVSPSQAYAHLVVR